MPASGSGSSLAARMRMRAPAVRARARLLDLSLLLLASRRHACAGAVAPGANGGGASLGASWPREFEPDAAATAIAIGAAAGSAGTGGAAAGSPRGGARAAAAAGGGGGLACPNVSQAISFQGRDIGTNASAATVSQCCAACALQRGCMAWTLCAPPPPSSLFPPTSAIARSRPVRSTASMTMFESRTKVAGVGLPWLRDPLLVPGGHWTHSCSCTAARPC